MIKKLKGNLREFLKEPAGSRFQDHYHRVHARGGNVILRKFLFIGGGLLVTAAGLVFLPAPGPGMVIIAIGAGMIAQESLFLAKALDRFEVRGRRVFVAARSKWRGSSWVIKASAIALVALCAAGVGYGSFVLFSNWNNR